MTNMDLKIAPKLLVKACKMEGKLHVIQHVKSTMFMQPENHKDSPVTPSARN